MPDAQALLARYRPWVRYDSLESYYTDSAAVITDSPGNVLKRAGGTVLAAAGAARPAGVPELSLNFLALDEYPGGESVIATDYIDEADTGYQAAARQMHAMPGHADKVHGRVVQEHGVTWLQYWFFMYYDDPGFLGLGAHEGDIEMIQISLDGDGNPDEVSYAQHRSGVRAPWSEVETKDGAPIVYSARGTHASMMRAGSLRSDRSFLTDHNDAGGPFPRLELVTLSLAGTPWAFWPGHWGGTRPSDPVLGDIGIEASSPPALTDHAAWQDPALFHSQCDPADLPPLGTPHTLDLAAPPAPQLSVTPVPDRGVVRVRYSIPVTGGAVPPRLTIGVGSEGSGAPPATVTVSAGVGEVELPMPTGGGPVVARATTHSDAGAVSPTVRVPAGAAW